MEPAQGEITVHTIDASVKDVWGDEGLWWVAFKGHVEPFAFGTKPDFFPGDRVKITFQKEG